LTPDATVRVAGEKADATVLASSEEPGHGEQETRIPASENPDASVLRSKRDLQREEDQDQPASPDWENDDEDQDQPGSPTSEPLRPFKVYAAIAKSAVKIAIQDRLDVCPGTIAEIFKTLCAQQGHPNNPANTQRAVAVAIREYDNNPHGFIAMAKRHFVPAAKARS
jgi:hypothetical protein